MKTLLVCGTSGYIGSVLTLSLLQLGYNVVGLDNLNRGSSHVLIKAFDEYPNFTFVLGSITNVDLIKKTLDTHKPECIFNMAGCVGEPSCKRDPELATITNVNGAKVLAESKSKETILFYPSTGSVLGNIGNLCTEEIKPQPVSHYAITKLEGEKITLSFDNTFSYRFSTLFGNSGNPRINLLLNNMVFDAINYRVLNIFQADFMRSFIHIKDAVDAIIYGYEHFSNIKHRMMNVGSPEGNWTKRQAAEVIKKYTGCQVFYVDNVYEDPDQRNYHVALDKVLDFGWKPKVSMEEGINNLIKSSALINIRNIYA